jgi:dTDP-glucose 4,6-dehydratase
MRRITDINNIQEYTDRIKFVYHDLKSEIHDGISNQIGHVDYIAHLAANSHVARSILYPKEFFEDNVMGTVNLLEWYRTKNSDARLLCFGTDEQFGPAPIGHDFKEDERWRPSNPYSAAKCGQAAAAYSYYITYYNP